MTLHDEILAQPDAVARLLEREGPALDAIATHVRELDPDFIVIAARGSSDHAALYAQYLFSIRLGLPVALATPSAITLYGASPRLRRALVLGISQSGRSPDIVAVLRSAAAAGALTVAVTNDTTSPLADAAAHVVGLGVEERAVAATLTYTTQLAALARLAVALDDGDGMSELAAVPDRMAEALLAEDQAASIATECADADRGVAIGRGFEYATAREWALKIQELGHVLVHAFSAADFEHGPIALVEPGRPVLAVEPRGPGHDERLELLSRVHDLGARLVVASDDPAAVAIDRGLPLPTGTPGWLQPLSSVIPCQLFAMHLARARGLDPDRPRTISKVTLTT
ncbi:MAG: SIS domain-containing protein [Chloroflexota bacterium]